MSENDEFTEQEWEELKQALGTESDDELNKWLQENASKAENYPMPVKKEDVFRFFREVLELKNEDFDKISRTGNLTDGELGSPVVSVRTNLDVALYAETEGLTKVCEFLRSGSNIIVNSSLSRKAKFLELIVTQKRVSRALGSPKRQVEKGLFSTKETTEGVENE